MSRPPPRTRRERYHGGLILYSLGSLFFEQHGLDRQPATAFRAVDLPTDASVTELRERKYDYLAEPTYREALVPIVTWDADQIEDVRAKPFILDHRPGETYGLPRAATESETESLAARMNELSTAWGTKVQASSGIITF